MSATWTDAKGREWDLSLDILSCNRVDSTDFKKVYKSDFSIYELSREDIQAIYRRPPFLFAIIWAVVRPQAIEKFQSQGFPINPDHDEEAAQLEFVSGVKAKAKQDGLNTFFEALGDFFPELRTGLSTLTQQVAILSEKMNGKLGELSPLLEEMMNEDFDALIQQTRDSLGKTREERVGEILSALPQ